MLENMISERAWRLDPVEAATVPITGELYEATEPRSMTVPLIRQWVRTAQSWTRAFLERFIGVPVGFEQVLHPFVMVLQTADDRAAVETALLRAVRKLAPATRIELISESGHADVEENGGGNQSATSWRQRPGQSPLEIPLRSGAVVHGRLRICSEAGGHSSLTKEASRRLLTLCTLAASVMEKVHRSPVSQWKNDRTADADEPSDAEPARNGPHIAKEFISTPMLRDATFLSVVLPFALTQSHRHRESVSLLWMEIDRMAGIQELLGRAAADNLVRHVGDAVTALLRSSDIVARLDDNRIIVVLPRATSDDAMFVARKIGREIADKLRDATVIPGVSVSIGVATFPTCGHNVSSLFNAADEALEQARSQGRGQVVLAPPRPTPRPTPNAQPRVHSL